MWTKVCVVFISESILANFCVLYLKSSENFPKYSYMKEPVLYRQQFTLEVKNLEFGVGRKMDSLVHNAASSSLAVQGTWVAQSRLSVPTLGVG